ncbi:MAG TPA: hypothetical protein VGE93_00450 [Bryobacteraceae bacterium]
MQEVTSSPELSKAPEITPKWHQPTLTVLEAADAETGTVAGSDGSVLS